MYVIISHIQEIVYVCMGSCMEKCMSVGFLYNQRTIHSNLDSNSIPLTRRPYIKYKKWQSVNLPKLFDYSI